MVRDSNGLASARFSAASTSLHQSLDAVVHMIAGRVVREGIVVDEAKPGPAPSNRRIGPHARRARPAGRADGWRGCALGGTPAVLSRTCPSAPACRACPGCGRGGQVRGDGRPPRRDSRAWVAFSLASRGDRGAHNSAGTARPTLVALDKTTWHKVLLFLGLFLCAPLPPWFFLHQGRARRRCDPVTTYPAFIIMPDQRSLLWFACLGLVVGSSVCVMNLLARAVSPDISFSARHAFAGHGSGACWSDSAFGAGALACLSRANCTGGRLLTAGRRQAVHRRWLRPPCCCGSGRVLLLELGSSHLASAPLCRPGCRQRRSCWHAWFGRVVARHAVSRTCPNRRRGIMPLRDRGDGARRRDTADWRSCGDRDPPRNRPYGVLSQRHQTPDRASGAGFRRKRLPIGAWAYPGVGWCGGGRFGLGLCCADRPSHFWRTPGALGACLHLLLATHRSSNFGRFDRRPGFPARSARSLRTIRERQRRLAWIRQA